MNVARIASDLYGYGLSDADIVVMVTSERRSPARTHLATSGRSARAGGFADLTILRRRGTGDVWSQIVRAREADVALVVIGGIVGYGDANLMTAAGARAGSFAMTIAGRQRRVAL